MSYLYSGGLVQGTVRMRSCSGGHSVCECSVCTLSGTSITVMSHRESINSERGGILFLFLIHNGESENEREEMRWCRCYEGQRPETRGCQGPSHDGLSIIHSISTQSYV